MSSNDKNSTTLSVVTDYFNWRLTNKTTSNDRLLEIVRQIGQRAESKFPHREIGFYCQTLSLSNLQNFHNEMGKELFDDGKITWTRIITFISFSALLTRHVVRQQRNDSVVSSMINWTTEFINKNLHSWLEKENYWVNYLFEIVIEC